MKAYISVTADVITCHASVFFHSITILSVFCVTSANFHSRIYITLVNGIIRETWLVSLACCSLVSESFVFSNGPRIYVLLRNVYNNSCHELGHGFVWPRCGVFSFDFNHTLSPNIILIPSYAFLSSINANFGYL